MRLKITISVYICVYFVVFMPINLQAEIKTNFPSKKIFSTSRLWDIGLSSEKIVWSSRASGLKRNSIYVYNLKTNKKTKIASTSNPFNPIICSNKIYYWKTTNFPTTGLYVYDLHTKKAKVLLTVSRNQVEAKCSTSYVAYSDNTKLYLYNFKTKKSILISKELNWTNRNWSLFSLNNQYLVYSEGDSKGDVSNLKVYHIKTKKTTTVSTNQDLIYEFGLYKYTVIYHTKSSNRHKIMRYDIKTKKRKFIMSSRKIPFIQDFYGTKILWMTFSQNLPYYSGQLFIYDYKTKRKVAITKKSFKSQIKYPARIFGNKIVWNAYVDNKSSIYITRM